MGVQPFPPRKILIAFSRVISALRSSVEMDTIGVVTIPAKALPVGSP
jgi:hypothetical protein